MASLVAAMSRASTSGVRRAKAFLVPSGLLTVRQSSTHLEKKNHIPDQSVNLDSLNVIQGLQRLLNLPLVRLDIHNKYQRVVLLNLLHRRLGVERVNDDLLGIEARLMGHRLARVLGSAGQAEGLGAVEGRVQADLANLVRVDLFVGNKPSAMGLLTRLMWLRGWCGCILRL